jgi:cell division protein FtsW
MLLVAVLALSAIGLVMVYSSSAILAHERTGDSFYFLKKQAVAAGVGWLALVVGLKLGYRRLARLAYPLLLLAIALMVLVLVPGIGVKVGGAYRWMRLGGFSFQP